MSRSIGSHTSESNTNNTINLELFDYEIQPIEMTGHFYWLNFYWLQNLLVYGYNSHKLQ